MIVRLLLILILYSCTLQAQRLVGMVVTVADGDTFTMLVNDEQKRIRLHGIDCPERGQDFGTAAKTFLMEMIAGKIVNVDSLDTDRYGRTIGMVFINGKNVNEELLKAGLAWHYKYYDKSPDWSKLEGEARVGKIGLWSIADPVPPWEWRRKKK